MRRLHGWSKGFGILGMLLALFVSACGGGGGDSVGVSSSNSLAHVNLSFAVPGQVAMAPHSEDRLLARSTTTSTINFLIPEALAAITPAGIASAAVLISGTGVTAVNDVFNVTPGVLVSRTYNLPIGTTPSLTIKAFSGPLGTGTQVYQSTPTTINLANTTAGAAVPVSVQMSPLINVPPVPTAPAISTTSGAAATSQIAPNDPNTTDIHTYAVTTQPANGTASVSTSGLVSYTSSAGFSGTNSMVVTVTDQGGLSGTVSITATVTAPQAATNNPPVFTGTPAIAQTTAVVGDTLTLTSIGTSDADGNTVTLSYQWKAAGVVITGATASTYRVTAAESAKVITCVVTANDGTGTANATATATTAGLTISNSAPVFTGTPAIVQTTAVVGDTLTLTGTGTSDADGNTVTLSYQWQAAGVPITGATTASYTIQSADSGKLINCVITADDGTGANNATAMVTTAAITVGNIAPVAGGIPSSGVLANYPFSGNANDTSGNAHNGTVINATLTTDRFGNPNEAYAFNGSNTEIALGSWFNFQSFTISLWVNPGSTQVTYADIFDNNHTGTTNFVMQRNVGANQYIFGSSGGPDAQVDLTAGQWQHIVVTRDSASLTHKYYLNGTLIQTVPGQVAANYSGQFLRLGRWGGGGRYWNGVMDEVVMYDHALTANEVQALYNHTNLTHTTLEDTQVAITLSGTDANNDSLTAKVTGLPTAGALYQTADGTTRGAQITAVPTAVSNANSQVIFVPVANANGVPYAAFQYVVNDGLVDSTAATVTVNVSPVNDLPVLATNTGLSLNSNAAATAITAAKLRTSDVDNTAAQLTYTVTAAPAKGTLKNGATSLTVSSTFTQADIDAGNISFTPTTNVSGADSFTFTLSDGAGGSIAATTFHISISTSNAIGSSLNFDGVNDYVNFGVANATTLGTGNFTIELWANHNSLAGEQVLFEKFIGGTGPGWTLTKLASNQIQFYSSAGIMTVTPPSLLPNTWNHIAVTRSAGTITMYWNGISIGSVAASGDIADAGQTLYLGNRNSQSLFMNGQLDEVRIWNVAHTQGQILADMNLQLAGNETGLVGYWKLDDASGTTALDSTANGNNGTLTNFALTGTTSNWVAQTTPYNTSKTWVGGSVGAATDWSNAANWSPAGVPAATDKVYIPASAANQPVLTANASVAYLVVDSGASLNLATFTLTDSGMLSAAGAISATTGSVILTGSNTQLSGTVPSLTVRGAVFLSGATTVTGNLTVAGSGLSGALDVNGQTLNVSGTLTSWSTNGGSGLKMVNAADAVTVGGNATFRDGSNANTSGWFTAGVLHMHGNFSETDSNPASFIATGTHKVVFDGTAAQTISFAHPGPSYFNDVEINNAAGVSFSTNATIAGTVTMTSGVASGAVAVTLSKGQLVDTAGNNWQVASTVITTVGLVSLDPLTTNLTVTGNVQLAQALTLTGNLTVAGSGLSGVLAVNGQTLSISGTLTSWSTNAASGLKMVNAADVVTVGGSATFRDGSNANTSGWFTAGALHVHGNFFEIDGNNSTFIATGTHKVVFDGTAAQTISFAHPGPSYFNDVEFNNTAGVSFSSAATVAGTVTMTSGTASGAVTVTLSKGQLVDTAGNNWQVASTVITTVGLVSLDPLTTNLTVTGNVQLAQALTLTGNLTVAGSGLSGVLAVNGQTLSISGTLTSWSTNAASGLKMVNAADVVTVGGNAIFRDGSNANTSGWFTAGALHMHGNFSETDSNNNTFIATGTHKVVFDGTAAQTVSFNHPGPSYFNDVEINNTAGVSFSTNATIAGTVTMTSGVASGAVAVTLSKGQLVDTAGNNWQVASTVITTVGLVSLDPLTTNLTVTGNVQLAQALTLTGNLTVAGSGVGGVLAVNGQTLSVSGTLTSWSTNGGSGLKMVNAADVVTVGGSATFRDGSNADTNGWFTAGVLHVHGNFSEIDSNNNTFIATGTHKVVFDGAAAQTINFNHPSTSYFNDVEINNTAGVSFSTNATIAGTVTMTSGVASGAVAVTLSKGQLVDTAGNNWQVTSTVITTAGLVSLDSLTTNLTVTGNVQLAQALTLTGNLTVAGSGLSGVLAVNGQTLSISGTLTSWSTNAASGLKMVNAADVVTVGGSATFRDGSNANTSGWFTAGALHVHGNFSEIDGNNSTFIATGTHKVVFDGAAAQTISFIHPGTSYFNDVEIANNVSLASNILIKGVGIIGAGVTPTITGNGRTVTAAGGTSIDGAIFDHVLLIASGAALGGKFDNVTFRNYAATDTQMTIALANTTFTPFNNLQFLSTPTTGKYISITTTGTTVTLAGAGTKPLYGIPKTSVVPGSTLNWGATADDSDGDGLTDSDELNTYGTDPNNADTDGDGLSDGAEVTAGTNPLLADTDGDGVGDGIEVFRGQNPLVANTVYFVDGTKPDDTGVGTSWATAKKTLSAAITAAPNGATASTATYILVAAGTYAPITITGRSNLQLVGSVSSTVLNPVDPLSSTIAVTTSGRPVMIDGNSTSIHLTGFIITGGNSSLGGGVRFDLSDGGIHLCNIKGNSSTNDAGGVYLNNSLRSKVVIDQKTTISGNIAVNSGGGIFAKGSFDMVETVVVNNTANGAAASSMGGGGLLLAPASASDAILIKNSVIAGNDASAGYGGGIYVRQPANLVTIFNNLISGNRAATAGGGIKLHDPRNSVVSSNTIAYNQVGSASSGGGITYFESGLSNGQIPSIHDNILWFNEDNTVEATINVGESLNDPLTIGNAITSAMSFNNDIGQGVVNNASDISINPNFQSGFYLDQTLTAPNGPIDAGSAATASSVFANGETTNVTGAADAGVLDMGGHYLKAYGFTGTASATVTPVATIVGNTTLQEVKIKPAIGGLNLGPGQSVFVQSGAGSTTGVTLSSLTGIQPSGAGSVLARDNGDGNYSVFVDTTGVATGSLILDVNESGSVLTGAATLSW